VRTLAVALLAAAGIALGLLAERQAYEWSGLRGWLPDLLAGWALLWFGLALVALRRHHRASLLLLAAGLSWFLFDFATTGPDAVRWVAARAAYVHRGPLLALALTLPAGVPKSSPAKAGALLALATAVVWPLWNDDASAIALAVALLVLATIVRIRAAGWRERAAATRGVVCVALIAAAVVADSARSLAGAGQEVADATVLAYAVAIAAAGLVLFTGVLLDAPATLAERVVSLERGGTRLRDALRDILGDPRLAIGFGSDPVAQVDDLGRPLLITDDRGRVTPVVVSGQQIGVVVHTPWTLDDSSTRSAVLAAAGLVAERARLREEVDRQIEAVEASRRRLLHTEEEERRRLAERLDHGPGAALAEVERLVVEAFSSDGGDEGLRAALTRASERLAHVRPEIDTLVRGLLVADASELRRALEQLADDLPLDVRLDIAEVSLRPEVASALWFVCSESIANAVKHAETDSVVVSLAQEDGAVRLSVVDRGIGGADPAGSGLAGLADRVGALGGRLAVATPGAGGTSVVAVLPVDTMD
jgi:signal transduction histidine kinase